MGDPGAVASIGILKNYLLSAGFSVDFPEEASPDLILHLDHHSHPYALLYMRQESTIAPLILRELARMHLSQAMIDWRDKNAGNHVRLVFNPVDSQKIEMGLVNAISMAYSPAPVLIAPKPVPWWKKLLPAVLFFGLTGTANAQVSPICLWDSTVSRCVGAGDWANRALRIVCLSGCGGAASFEDSDPFVAGTTAVNIGAGVFNDGLADLTSGQAGAYRLTPDRGVHVNLRNVTGTEIPLPAALGGSGGFKVECLGGTCGGAASFEDEDAFTVGTSAVGPIGLLVDETTPDSCPEDTSCAPRQSANRNVYVQIRDITNERSAAVTAANALKTDGSAVTQPVSGTFWQATQPVSGTFFQATQPISAAALPLPAGAATSAAQLPDGHNVTIDNAGGAAAVNIQDGGNVITIDGSIANAFLLDATYTGRMPAGASPADNESNTNTALSRIGAFLFCFDGTNWDRCPGDSTNGQIVNLKALNGVTISSGVGIADTGTQRVVIAQELTYSAGTTAKTATAAGTGVFFNICGSATKTIRIQRFVVSGTVATTAVYADVVLKRTSTATTAGTATTLTNLPYDSTSAAATAVVKYYTVLGTAGTSVGVITTWTQHMPVTGTPAAGSTPPVIWIFRDTDSEAPTLRGTAQCMEANFGTTTTNAPTLSVSVAWTEK